MSRRKNQIITAAGISLAAIIEKIIILGHENPDVDSIVSGYLLEKILKNKGYDAEFIIPDKNIEQESLDICRNNGLDPIKFQKDIKFDDKNIKYILVDHNERNVNGEIVCIIDHHPTSKEIKIDNYYNKKISSTACYICNIFDGLVDEHDLKLAIVATMVDTASFHFTKSRKEDKKWVMYLCKKYEFDYNKLYNQGLCLTKLDDAKKASLNGFKKYNFNNLIVHSSYIQIKDLDLNKTKIKEILNVLKEYIKHQKLIAFVFIVHDMRNFKTMYYLITNEGIEKKYYDSYTARGTTIMPEVEKILFK